MRKEDKLSLENKEITESLTIACLAACESVISKNAYLEKKWANYQVVSNTYAGDWYKEKRIQWMKYRNKLKQLLYGKYSANELSQLVRMENKATIKAVEEVIIILDTGDYKLLV